MSFFNSFMDAASSLTNSMLGDKDTTVKTINVDAYVRTPVHCRQDGLVLYGPHENGRYELVFLRPYSSSSASQGFSLLRTPDIERAESEFGNLHLKFPLLSEIVKDFASQGVLQRYVDVMRENPSWSVAHLAAFFNLPHAFNHKRVKKLINEQDDEERTPLHLAVRWSPPSMIKQILTLDPRFDIFDKHGDSVFHYAATRTQEVIQLLAESNSAVLNVPNGEGHTPLHVACRADKTDIVEVQEESRRSRLLPSSRRAQVEPERDLWKATTRALLRDITTDLSINSTRVQSECVRVLLSYGAKVDVKDKDGNTPLHLASKKCAVSIMQWLCVSGAPLNDRNLAGLTPRHLAATSTEPSKDKAIYVLSAIGAERCIGGVVGCAPGCSASLSYEGYMERKAFKARVRDPFHAVISAAANAEVLARQDKGADPQGPRKVPVLCLDGGGIRGLILVQMLLALEEFTGETTQKSFKWIVGTSTGGFLALNLASGRSLRECQRGYLVSLQNIFTGIRPYSSEKLERTLQREYGSTTVMSDLKGVNVFVTTMVTDRLPTDLHLFRNYLSPEELLGVDPLPSFPPIPSYNEVLVAEAARFTGSAPTYFRAKGAFLDGGLCSNNPTMDLLTEMVERNLALKCAGQDGLQELPSIVVSLGTGKNPVIPVETPVDVCRPDSILGAARSASNLQKFFTILIDVCTQTEQSTVDRARAWCYSLGVPYFRLNPPLSEETQLDEQDDAKLALGLWETMVYIRERKDEFEDIARILRSAS